MFNTDKTTKGLFNAYSKIFDEYDVRGTILEIGIFHGGSLELWKKTGRFNKIIGCDINIPDFLKGKFDLFQINQTDSLKMTEMANQYGQFDFIIEDASHLLADSIKTFEILWPYTKGIYIIEDLLDIAYHSPEQLKAMLGWLNQLFIRKRELEISEIRVVMNENPDSFHSYIMLRKGITGLESFRHSQSLFKETWIPDE